MGYQEMARRLIGEVPGTPLALVQRVLNDALEAAYNRMDWSFQKGESGWLCPGVVLNQGSFTTTPYSTTVVADAVATAGLAAYVAPPFITQMQYRDPSRTPYNIVGYAAPTMAGGFATLTLDRPWMEPTSGPGQPFMIYQCYFVAPVQDFRKFVEIRDTTNAFALDFWSRTPEMIAQIDPQRTDFSDPVFVIPHGIDNRPGTATPGWPVFELWPHQLSYVPYSFTYKRRGALLAAPTDSVPYPFTEALIEEGARMMLYQWKEAQRDKREERGAGANWTLLMQASAKRYEDLMVNIISVDGNLNGDLYHSTRKRPYAYAQPYSNRLGGFNVGGY